MREIKPMADALAVWADEGRVIKRDNNGESLSRRYQPLVSEWGNPPNSNIGNLGGRFEVDSWAIFLFLASAFNLLL